ncbi:MAG: hypothetical protein JSV51_04930 [Candidatus Bathyarchaeota archaeon]|nr:MAG: hypothetical protein JSV51_04930 [Candidatus Bathyarchaeota archaeon]
MKTDFLRSKWFILAIIIVLLITTVVLIDLRISIQEREDAVLTYFRRQEGMPETFVKLENLTSPSDVILCWWDYGRAVQAWSHREVIEAYPSRDIWHTVGASRDLWHNLAAQVFGTWGSSEKIHDLSKIFMLPETQALPIMEKYGVTYAIVFTPDEFQKYNWIAEIGGYNPAEYLILEDSAYQATALGAQTTLLRLMFDDTLAPQYFTKIFDNSKGKIFRVDYP